MSETFISSTAQAVQTLSKIRIVPVLVLTSGQKALRLGELLLKHGLGAAEITFRTKEAAGIIRSLSARFPELYIGAGTILNPDDLKRAFDSGARFAVAPGLNPRVVKAAVENGFPFAPGVCTPSEIEQACDLGCRFLKFFPAEAAGGISMLKAMAAPYRHLGLKFMPTGGVTSRNAPEYLAVGDVAAVGGTWLGKAADLEADEWEKIETLIAEAATIAKG